MVLKESCRPFSGRKRYKKAKHPIRHNIKRWMYWRNPVRLAAGRLGRALKETEAAIYRRMINER